MEEEERREQVLEKTAAVFQPNFKSKCITEDQLNKFKGNSLTMAHKGWSLMGWNQKELHRKRLRIKEKSSKIHKNLKGNASRGAKEQKEHSSKNNKDEDTYSAIEDSPVKETSKTISSLQQDNEAMPLGTKKRQKLHWGLDTKERWERKANM